MDAKNLLLAAADRSSPLPTSTFWYTTVRRRRAALGTAAPDIAPTPLHDRASASSPISSTRWASAPTPRRRRCTRRGTSCRDEKIPGTLNVGHATATFVQALIYMTIVEVEFTTLVTIIAAAMLGAWLGAGVVAGFDRRKVQLGMGIALLGAASLMVLSLPASGRRPASRSASRAPSWRIAFGISVGTRRPDDARHRLSTRRA